MFESVHGRKFILGCTLIRKKNDSITLYLNNSDIEGERNEAVLELSSVRRQLLFMLSGERVWLFF